MGNEYKVKKEIFNETVLAELRENKVPSKVARIIAGAIIDKNCHNIDIRQILENSGNKEAVKYADNIDGKCIVLETPRNWRAVLENAAARAVYLQNTR